MPDLDADAVLARLDAERDAIHLVVADTVDSTNERLLCLAAEGAPTGFCLAALTQTAGRGRRGRRWLSDSSGSLTFSLLWRFEHHSARQLSGLSLAVALALARALEKLGVDGIALKWPNDLLRQGRKIAGILVELVDPVEGDVGAVIGIGLNVRLDDTLSDALPTPAHDLRDARGQTPERSEVLAALLRELLPILRQFAMTGFPPFRAEWLTRSAHQERRIRLALSNHQVETGICVGLSSDGALLLKQGDRITHFLTGDVSLRLNE